jgi:hypothetical protein
MLESQAFNDSAQVSTLVIYTEAGMFVSYLIDTFGLSVQQAEHGWLAFLDASM